MNVGPTMEEVNEAFKRGNVILIKAIAISTIIALGICYSVGFFS